jgi:hypothetical protein
MRKGGENDLKPIGNAANPKARSVKHVLKK